MQPAATVHVAISMRQAIGHAIAIHTTLRVLRYTPSRCQINASHISHADIAMLTGHAS
jgi:hypothetical protein